MSKETAAQKQYRNKSVQSSRGGYQEWNNTTGEEGVNIGTYGGSNWYSNENVTSALNTNNQQEKTNNDSFQDVKNNKNRFTGGDSVERTVKDTYSYKGFGTQEEIDAVAQWKEAYRPIAEKNAQFDLLRGGKSSPGNIPTLVLGGRGPNPTINQEAYEREDVFPDYYTPTVTSDGIDEVSTGVTIGPFAEQAPGVDGAPAEPIFNLFTGLQIPGVNLIGAPPTAGQLYVRNPSIPDIQSHTGSNPLVSAATEGGTFAANPNKLNLDQEIVNWDERTGLPLQQKMGDGGNTQDFTFRNKFEMVGAQVNTFPSTRTDPNGTSEPSEVVVGQDTTFVNVGSVPHIEEVDNDKTFPVGNYDLLVGNKYGIEVGSGGVQLKTTGSLEVGAATYKLAAYKVNIQSSGGVNITSENSVLLQSERNLSFRSNNQILIEPGLGVRDNLIVGGGASIAGEVYLQHVTAPAEMQVTEEVNLFAKLLEGLEFECDITGHAVVNGVVTGNGTVKLTKASNENKVECGPHSHHFKNLPLKLTESNSGVRIMARAAGINTPGMKTPAEAVSHAYDGPKIPSNDPSPPTPLTIPIGGAMLTNIRPDWQGAVGGIAGAAGGIAGAVGGVADAAAGAVAGVVGGAVGDAAAGAVAGAVGDAIS